MTSRARFPTAVPCRFRNRGGGFLPFVAVTEVSVCLAIFASLGVVLAFVPDAGDGFGSAASAAEANPIRRIEMIGVAEGRRLAVLFDDTCFLHDLETAEAAPVWDRCGDERVTAIAGSPAGPRLAVCRCDGGVIVVDADADDPVWEGSTGAGAVSSAAFSPDGRTLAVGTANGVVLLLDGETGEARRRVGVGGDVRAVCFTPDGRHLIVPQADGGLSVRDVVTAGEVRRLPAAQGQVMTMSVRPDGGAVAAGTAAGEVVLHDLAGDQAPVRLRAGSLPVLALAFGGDGEWLAAGLTGRRPIRLYSADGSRSLGALGGHPYGTRGLIGSGRSLLSAGLDGRVVEWNVSTGQGRELSVR